MENFSNISEKPQFPELASELLDMHKADQDMRHRWEDGDFTGENLDIKNSQRLKEIIDEIGAWPSASKVGVAAARSAWLIAQHCDHDRDMQIFFLTKLKAVSAHERDEYGAAMLEDRLNVAMGNPQEYGSQWYEINNVYNLQPIAGTLAEVNSKRLGLGMSSLEDYISDYIQQYSLEINDLHPNLIEYINENN